MCIITPKKQCSPSTQKYCLGARPGAWGRSWGHREARGSTPAPGWASWSLGSAFQGVQGWWRSLPITVPDRKQCFLVMKHLTGTKAHVKSHVLVGTVVATPLPSLRRTPGSHFQKSYEEPLPSRQLLLCDHRDLRSGCGSRSPRNTETELTCLPCEDPQTQDPWPGSTLGMS